MQWETDPLDMNLVLLLQLVNTPGNEVAPRSDIVGKDLQDHLVRHYSLQLDRELKNSSETYNLKSKF